MAATVFSTQLQKLRKAKGVKQEQLAEHLGVSTQAVSKWENGSYPDGDLLPRIAKFFDVSIDYLYGDEKENMRMDERILEYMKKETDESAGREAKIMELHWMALGNGTVPTGYLPLPKVKKEEGQTGSCYMELEGVSFLRVSEDMRYGFVMERPENGYESYLSKTKELAEVFDLLREEEAVRILLFMMTLDTTELVRAETVANYLHIPKEKAEHVLERAACIGEPQGIITCSTLLKEDGTEEKLYTAQQYVIVTVLRLFIVANDMLYPIRSYRNLSVNTSKTLLDRNKLLELLREKPLAGKEEQHE